MKVDFRRDFLFHPVLGDLDAFFVEGSAPYLMTKSLPIGAFAFASTIMIWTDPEHPSEVAMAGAISVFLSGSDFRDEVERRLFADYVEVTRGEYLEYVHNPAYEMTSEMLPELHTPQEIWSVLCPLDHAISITEPDKLYPSKVAEVSLSFKQAFDKEHDTHIVFKDGKFFEIMR